MPDADPKTSRDKEFQQVLSRPEVRDAEFRVLFDQTMTGIAYVAPDGMFMRCNRKYSEMLGYSPKELEGRKTYQEITHPDDVAADEAEADDVAKGSQDSYQIQKRYLHKQGYSVWVNLQVYRIEDGQGGFVHFLAQTQELRLPDSHLQVGRDANGNPFLQPVVPVQAFILRNWKWVASVGVPTLLSILGGAGATVRNYYMTQAQLEQAQKVMVSQDETIKEQKKLIQELQKDVQRIGQKVGVVRPAAGGK